MFVALLLLFFPSFYFLSALQSDNNSNTVYVLRHKCVLGLSQTAHFSPCLKAWAKMSESDPRTYTLLFYFTSVEVNCMLVKSNFIYLALYKLSSNLEMS